MSTAGVLFALNFFIAAKLFFTEYTDRVATGDAAFISISRYIMDHGGESFWWPVWYNGIPWRNAYPPLLHQLVAWMARGEGISAALAHHQFCVIAYAFAPVSLFLLLKQLTGSLRTGLLGGLGFSILSPSTIFIPWVRQAAAGWFGPWRLCVLEAYGDAPHMFAFALVPIAVLLIDRARSGRNRWMLFAACGVTTAILLTNWLGVASLAFALAAYSVARIRVGHVWSEVAPVLFVCLAAYALASPWIPPSTISLVLANSQTIDGDFRSDVGLLPLRLIALGVVLLATKAACLRWRASFPVQFAIFLVILPGSISPLREIGVNLVPQAHRYQWEADLAIWLLAAISGGQLFRVLPRWAFRAALFTGLCVTVVQVARYRRYSDELVRAIDMRSSVEYKTAAWLSSHSNAGRVFAIGSVCYWMNAFSDVRQVSGAFAPATPNAANAVALQAISGTEGPELAIEDRIDWLRAMGADFIVVGGEHTRAPFRTFRAPGEFAKLGAAVWSEGDDFIYEIPRRSRSISHVIRADSLARSTESSQIKLYAGALERERPPFAALTWRSAESATVEARLQPQDVISVQLNYEPAWRAEVGGHTVPISRDGLGFMVISPGQTGLCKVDLKYAQDAETLAAKGVATLSLFVLLVWSASGSCAREFVAGGE